MAIKQRIKNCLWFDGNAEEAVNFYLSVFERSKINTVTRYGDTGPGKKGSVMTIGFELEGLEFLALNAGPHFKFNEAISMMVDCETQDEIDELWEKLTSGGGNEVQCGWLKDRFGLSWQIVPASIDRMWEDGNAEKLDRMMAALVEMVKLDKAALERAYNGG